MKVLQVTCAYPPYRSGIGNVAKEYVDVLEKEGHKVQVISPQTTRAALKTGNGGVFLSIFNDVRKSDIVHLHYPFYGSAFLTALSCFIWRKPLVITYHMVVHVKGWRGTFIWLQNKYIEPLILKIAKRVLVSSVEYGELIRLEHEGLREMPFTIDTEKYHPTQKIATKHCTFIFVGGMDKPHYFKGIDVLLNAAARLMGDWELILIGDGELKEKFERQAERLGIQRQVTFKGGVPETAAYYREADVHVLPSINSNEAFGIVTLEAMASGIPSIVTSLPGVRTVVVNGKTGWHVAPNVVTELQAAMQSAIDNPDERWNRGSAARKRAEEVYATNKLAKKLEALYEEIV